MDEVKYHIEESNFLNGFIQGRTPIYIATLEHSIVYEDTEKRTKALEIIKYLLSQGANPSIKNIQGNAKGENAFNVAIDEEVKTILTTTVN